MDSFPRIFIGPITLAADSNTREPVAVTEK
jgi:hypothetical protein